MLSKVQNARVPRNSSHRANHNQIRPYQPAKALNSGAAHLVKLLLNSTTRSVNLAFQMPQRYLDLGKATQTHILDLKLLYSMHKRYPKYITKLTSSRSHGNPVV